MLIIGGQFSGDFSTRKLKRRFHVTVADAKEFFETTGVALSGSAGEAG